MLPYANICQYPVLSDTSITFYSTVHVYMLLPACVQYHQILSATVRYYLLILAIFSFFDFFVIHCFLQLSTTTTTCCYHLLSKTICYCYYLLLSVVIFYNLFFTCCFKSFGSLITSAVIQLYLLLFEFVSYQLQIYIYIYIHIYLYLLHPPLPDYWILAPSVRTFGICQHLLLFMTLS